MADIHVIVPIADGFEEIEAVVIVDILRRAGCDVTIAGVGGVVAVGSHGIGVVCDRPMAECDPADADAIVLPGGMPGTIRLGDSPHVTGAIRALAAAGKLVAAICAAPMVLNALGVLEGRRATSHPAHADAMDRCVYLEEPVVTDRNVITSRGAGTAIAFAAELVTRLVGAGTAKEVLRAIQAPAGS